MVYPGVQLSEVTRWSPLSQLSSGFLQAFWCCSWRTDHYQHFILIFTFQSLLSSRARFWYWSSSFSTIVSPGTAISIKSAVFLSFSTATISRRLCSITWCIWIHTSQRIFTFSVSNTGSAVCWYHYSKRGRPYVSRRLHGTIPASLSCPFAILK